MARGLRIDVAYCVELNRVVDIQEACNEFFVQQEHAKFKHEKFNFLCSDEACRYTRTDGVRVTAVNHYRVPAEQQMSPHYRELDPHAENCYWKELDRALEEDGDPPDVPPDEREKTRRRVARKVKRLITKFVIPVGDDQKPDAPNIAIEIGRIKKDIDPLRRRRALRQYVRGLGATATNLEALVTCFEELKELGELDQEFEIDGVGKLTFRQAFRQVSLGPTARFAVYYGGARLNAKRYGGAGFALTFMDPVQQQPVSMYVSPDAIRHYAPSARMVRMMDDVGKHPQPKPYVRVYWIGTLEHKEDKGRWSAAFGTLAHVVFRVIQPKAKAPRNEEGESGPGDRN